MISAYLVSLVMFAAGAGDLQPEGAVDSLAVDPLLIEQAAEVWRVLATDQNPVWPGWDATATPMLFYLPGIQDVLINHPNPPAGFRPYRGPIQFPGGTMFVRDGETVFEFDGQNTSREINQVQTLVVADTLSNRIVNVKSLIQDPRPVAEKLESLTYQQLGSDPLATMGMIAHEAFHVFQHHQAPGKGGNELALMRYPTLSVTNNVGFALEGTFLAGALAATDDAQLRQAAVQWLAVRRWRREALSDDDVAYEDGTEFNEGLAKFIEYRLTQVLEQSQPSSGMWRLQGFRGYGDLSGKRTELIEQMQKMLSGEVNVNNDPYGASPVRMRLYYSGMAIAALLDRLSDHWRTEILQPDTTLTELVETALAASEEELAAASANIQHGERYEQLVQKKTQLQEDGQAFVAEILHDIQQGPQSALVIDYSALEDARVAMSFTPFGILPVDSQRAIFRLVPVSARFRPETMLRQTRPVPVLRDDQKRQLTFQLSERISQQQFLQALGWQEIPAGPVTVERLELPGAELQIGRATLIWQESRILIRLEPGSS